MKSKGKTKPNLKPEGREDDSLCLGVGKRTASYSRKRVKGRLISNEASPLPTSISSHDPHSDNVGSKATARATGTSISSEKEKLADKSLMESHNVKGQTDEENIICYGEHQNNPTAQSNLPCSAEPPSSVSKGDHALGSSADCTDVERAENPQFASRSLDREKSIPVLDSDASKKGMGGADILVSSKATVVDMSIEIADDLPENGAITGNMKEETSSDTEVSEESQDVKVCDICGDAGQEEFLAICSRCSDGAEHTYCMEVKLDELPEDDWLCEGCIMKEEIEKEEIENQQQEKSEAEDKVINEPCSDENSQCDEPTLNSRGARTETNDATPVVNDATPVVAGSMKELLSTAMSTLRKLKKLDSSSLSRETTAEASCRPTTTTLLGPAGEEKSTNESDMIRPEPLQLATSCDKSENILGQQNLVPSDSLKIQSFTDSRGTLSKSFSFNHSKVPKVKPLMEDFPQMQKSIKEPNLNNSYKGLMRASTKSVSFRNMNNHISGTNSVTLNKMQSNNSQWPQVGSTKQMKEITTVDKKNTSLMVSPPVSSVGTTFKDIKSISLDEKSNKSNDSNHSGTKIGLTGASSLAADEVKQTSVSTSMNGGNKGNKWKDAVELARTQRNFEIPNQSVEASASYTDRTSESSAKQFSSAVSSSSLKMPAKEVSANAQVLMGSPCTDPFKTAADNHVQQKGIEVKIPSFAPAKGNRNTVLNVVDKWSIKPNLQISMEQASFLSQPFQASVIPEFEYIWQGTFQVLRTGKHPRTHDGFQAHLSTFVSTKVIEVANMFPCKLQLEEVPRLSSWPLQFKENSPKEDNVALFFFAKDIPSYKHHYQKLLENMLKNDLALRGNINAVELLIFPSNVLPKGYQQWNKMTFLWGIFREKKINCTRDLDINTKPTLLQSNVASVEDLSSHTAVHAGISHDTTRDSILKGRLLQEVENDSPSSTELQNISFSRAGNVRINELKEPHFHTKALHQDANAEKVLAEQNSHLLPTSCSSEIIKNPLNSSISRTKPKIYIDIEQLPMEVEDDPKCPDKLGDSDTNDVGSCDVNADSKIMEQKIKHESVLLESAMDSANDLSRNLVETENINGKSRLNLKRTHSSLGETTTVSQVSEAYGEVGLPNDAIDGKKMKIENGKHSSYLSIEDNVSNKESMGTRSSLSALMGKSTWSGKFTENLEVSGSLLTNKDSLDSNIPDLELVLGGNKRLSNQVNMLMSAPKRSKECNQDKLLVAPVNDLDDESGSLTLSLAFPDSGRMKLEKPIAQAKQPFLDKPHVS